MSAWFLDSELSTCYGSHTFPCWSLLLCTTILNDNDVYILLFCIANIPLTASTQYQSGLYVFIYSTVFHLDYSAAPSSVVSRLTRNLIRSSSLLSDHSEEVELPAPVQQWLDQYSSWCNDWKIKSLDVLLARYIF